MTMPENSVEYPKKVILEIGPGEKPFPTAGERMLQKNEIYLGLEKANDGFGNVLKMAQRNINEQIPSQKGRIQLVAGDGGQIPLHALSVDEVILCNVVGGVSVEDLEKIITDVSRVLKPNGEIAVIETISPEVLPKSRAQSFLSKYGFAAIKLGKTDDEFIRQYQNPLSDESEFSHGMPYAALFRKKGEGKIKGLFRKFLRRK